MWVTLMHARGGKNSCKLFLFRSWLSLAKFIHVEKPIDKKTHIPLTAAAKIRTFTLDT